MKGPLKIGNRGTVWVNQALRPFEVMAVLGDRALIEYEMPNGRDYLVEVDVDFNQEGKHTWINRTWDKLPKRWQAAVEQGVEDLKAERLAAIERLNERSRLDGLWARNTGFCNLRDCLNAGGSYRPSLDMRQEIMRELADDYDAAQAARGDDRRAYRYGEQQ